MFFPNDMKVSPKRTIQFWLPVLLFGILGTSFGFGVSTLFPAGDTWMYDWQLAQLASRQQADSSIILLTLDGDGPAGCGPDRWNTATLAQTISALNQAQAKVIAPALPIGIPTSPECGDIAGLAKLIEATKQAGNVVYPSSVPDALASEASRIGVLDLEVDEDGIFRRIPVNVLEGDSDLLPFGLAIVPRSTAGLTTDTVKDGLLPLVGRWADRPFHTYSFGQIWELVTTRDYSQLSTIVKNKFVVLVPVGDHTVALPTAVETAAPVGFLHANLLQSALSHSWIKKRTWEQGLVITFLLAMLAAWFPLRFPGGWGLLSVGLLLIGYWGLTLLSFHTLKEYWPFVAPLVASAVAVLGNISWSLYRGRTRTEHQIRRVSAQLVKNQEQLIKKERLAKQLNDEVTRARELAEQSTQKYQEVAASAERHQNRLHHAQGEVETTRQRLQALQSQLDHLQRSMAPRSITPTPLPDDNLEQLRQECESLGIFTRSSNVLKVFQDLKKAAHTNNPILLLGETGTGKELFAQATHHLSQRSRGPFISINIAAIRPELFESELFGSVKGAYTGALARRGFLETADGGTLFLDEIGELPLSLQAKLLRVLEEGSFYRVGQSSPTHVDVRIVTATNLDLIQEVSEGRYREDLYYRLRSIVLRLPPLRERGGEEVDLLAHHFLRELSQGHPQQPLHFTQAALQAIQSYDWPGNIRELRQTLIQAVALTDGPVLNEEDLRLSQPQPTESSGTATEVSDFSTGGNEEIGSREDSYILSCLRHHKFDMQATAKALNWDRGTVTQRLKGMGFQALVDHQENIAAAAETLAGKASLVKVVEVRLREYYNNLMSSTKQYHSVDDAIADSRRRLRNLPDRHFPAVESLIRQHFQRQAQ
ncbi:MAG: sigma 54-interacting transcriptional regulator [Nitrospirota bacterium]|nr:MAG: sigma 54-interacting transcriptional regulator [Nitrospirota bacterium]